MLGSTWVLDLRRLGGQESESGHVGREADPQPARSGASFHRGTASPQRCVDGLGEMETLTSDTVDLEAVRVPS